MRFLLALGLAACTDNTAPATGDIFYTLDPSCASAHLSAISYQIDGQYVGASLLSVGESSVRFQVSQGPHSVGATMPFLGSTLSWGPDSVNVERRGLGYVLPCPPFLSR